jgi:hypothetical protein
MQAAMLRVAISAANFLASAASICASRPACTILAAR